MHQGYNVSKERLIGEVVGILAVFFLVNAALALFAYLSVDGFTLAALEAAQQPEGADRIRLFAILTAPLGMLATIGVTVLFLNARGIELYELGLRRPVPWPRTLGLALLIAGGVYVASIGVQFVLSRFGIEANLDDFAIIQGNPLLFLFAITLFTWGSAAFGEEILFRGFIMRNLQALFGDTKTGWAAANVLQASIFGVFHFNQGLGGVIPVFLVALVFGYAFIRFGKTLWPLIIAHGLVDMVSFTLVYLGWTEF